jgi:hypothetical protein
MDRTNKTKGERQLSDKSKTEQANIQMDREFYGDADTEQPKETTVPFINRNQS